MASVLITGANRGIGLALARGYAARGDHVIGTARKPDEATELKQVAHTVLALDVRDGASHARLAAALAGQPIDILIANAGMMGPRGGLDDAGNTPEFWAEVLSTNITGVFFTVRSLVSNVVAAKGRIAVLSSRMGSSERAVGSSYLYRASKAAAANLAANFAAGLKTQGVSVAAYHPGWVKTDMGGGSADISAEVSAKGLIARIDALTPATTGAFEDYDGSRIAY